MSDFLLNLARATVEPGAALRPRLASRFEPLAPLEAAEVRSVESFPATRQEMVMSRSLDAAPGPAWQRPEEPSVVAKAETATHVVESAHTPRADGASSFSPSPSPETLPSSPGPLDDRVAPLPTGSRPEPAASAVRAEAPRSIPSDEPADGALVPSIGEPARLASPLSPPRAEPALLPPASTRPTAGIAWAQEPAPATEPTVHVTIGRIEIRATTRARDRAPRAERPTGIMSLDEYVERRRGGRR